MNGKFTQNAQLTAEKESFKIFSKQTEPNQWFRTLQVIQRRVFKILFGNKSKQNAVIIPITINNDTPFFGNRA